VWFFTPLETEIVIKQKRRKIREMNIINLPSEILSIIIKYVITRYDTNHPEDLLNCVLVCQKFYQIVLGNLDYYRKILVKCYFSLVRAEQIHEGDCIVLNDQPFCVLQCSRYHTLSTNGKKRPYLRFLLRNICSRKKCDEFFTPNIKIKKIDNKLIRYDVVAYDMDDNCDHRLILSHDNDIVEYTNEQIEEKELKFIGNLFNESCILDPFICVTITMRYCYGFRKIERIEEFNENYSKLTSYDVMDLTFIANN